MDIDLGKAVKLYEIKKNQIKLVKRRGYDVGDEQNILNYTSDQFIDIYVPYAKSQKKSVRNILTNIYKNEEGDKLYVYFADVTDSKQLGVKIIQDFIDGMHNFKARNGIIITSNPLSPDSKKKIQSLSAYNIYTFTENEMSYDPTEHYLTPEHRALSREDQREFLEKNNISIDQLPIILTTDMISRYYGFQTGQVIKINRTNLYDTIVQNSIYYRAVKEDISTL